jgi:large subunit ribosomal protein L25
MADRATIHAQPRTVLGKKVKQLRNNGILPANIYGRGLESVAVQVDEREFLKTVRAAGVRTMFELNVEGEPEPRFVLVRRLDRHGGTGGLIHADFYQVDLNRPIQTNVSLAFHGEAPAVRDLAGTLLQMIDTLAVRCLPLKIPDSVPVDLSLLKSFDVTITVGDLDIPSDVEVLNDPSIPVVTVNPPRLRLRDAEEEEGVEGEEGAAEGEEADGEASESDEE